MKADRLTSELRKIEKEVDHYYKSNPLVKLPFATAVWHLLAFAEEKMMLEAADYSLTSQDSATLNNNFVVGLKYPMYWLHNACEQNGQVPSTDNGNAYNASRTLFDLGWEYAWFVAAYTYANHGWIELELQGSTIQVTEDLFGDREYEAYNSLIKLHEYKDALSSMNFDNCPIDAVKHSLKVQGDRFSYKLNPRMVSDTITAMKPRYDVAFSLPSEWQFSHYTLGDFRKVFEAISAMAYIHWIARRIAMDQGCNALGHDDSIYVLIRGELLRRVARYSGVSDAKVLSIFDDLSYGNRGISHPDPALQPLIKLNSEVYAIMPLLWLTCSPERNLTVLLNKLPSEKEIYSKLVDEKEELMRGRFTTCLSAKDFRFVCGSVSDLPDIDLAIIKDSEKACLLLELKWFIDPAEAREIIEKSEEIEKGISQELKLKRAFANNHEPLLKKT